MLNQTVYGVDFGSDAAKIYSLRKDRITSEKNMIAVKDGEQVIAVGNQAYEMLEKNPPEIDVSTPVEDGMISDADRGGFVLDKLLMRAEAGRGINPILYFSAPLNMSRIERKAFCEIGLIAGFRENRIFLVDQPLCDALSLGIPIQRTKGSMIINVGAQHTVISVIAGGQVILSERVLTGGKRIDEAICDTVRRKTNVLIGTRTAGRVKHAIADCYESDDARRMFGMDTLSGVPGEVVVTADLVREAMLSELEKAAAGTKRILTRIPPQIAGYIRAEGIYLTGGTARVAHIADYFKEYCGAAINLSKAYEYETINGIREIAGHKALQKMAYTTGNEK
ncbi:MAG: rod shape-determining protein [Lachnospiraceae bacterium]|nr:rod shape-determining protein [Lachnospiraceae bacterium]